MDERDGLWLTGYRGLPPDVVAHDTAGHGMLGTLGSAGRRHALLQLSFTNPPQHIDPDDCCDVAAGAQTVMEFVVLAADIPDAALERLASLWLLGGTDLLAHVWRAVHEARKPLRQALAGFEAAVAS